MILTSYSRKQRMSWTSYPGHASILPTAMFPCTQSSLLVPLFNMSKPHLDALLWSVFLWSYYQLGLQPGWAVFKDMTERLHHPRICRRSANIRTPRSAAVIECHIEVLELWMQSRIGWRETDFALTQVKRKSYGWAPRDVSRAFQLIRCLFLDPGLLHRSKFETLVSQ